MIDKNVQIPPVDPFDKILMTMSGGGFRAAAFGLGALSYLNTVKYRGKNLLERVGFIASASGGTIPAILYSMYKYQDLDFSQCYNKLRNEILKDCDLAEKAVRNLNDDKVWDSYPTKTRNIINAFAITYDQAFATLADGKTTVENTFNVYWRTPKDVKLEVCFNSSEFVNGRTFRFQTDDKHGPHGLLGNLYLRVTPTRDDAVRELRLGDILAASSCFPGGFEPIVFPDDFARDKSHLAQLLGMIRQLDDHDMNNIPSPRPACFSLMDGGVTDNQGVESMELEFKRSMKRDPYDLMLVCDVANYFIEEYKTPQAPKGLLWNVLTIDGAIDILRATLAVFLLTGFLAWQNICPDITLPLATVTALVSIIYIILYFATSFKSYKASLGENLWDRAVTPVIRFIRSRKIAATLQYMENRAMSVVKILSDIDLLQIRRLNYNYIFSMPVYDMRVKMVSIYKLSRSNRAPLQAQYREFVHSGMSNQGKLSQAQANILLDGGGVMDTAQQARDMGTTLWFGDVDSHANTRDKIIACGQFTTCHNLLEYAYAIHNDPSYSAHIADINALIKLLEADWKEFNNNPLYKV